MSTKTAPFDEALASGFEQDLISGSGSEMERYFRTVGAGFHGFTWSPGREDLDEEILRLLHAYWNHLPRGPAAPLARAVSPGQMKAALGFVMLLEAVRDGRDYRYRVYGSAIAARSGFDATGKTVSECPTAPLAEFFVASYRACRARKAPLFIRHAPPVLVHVVSWDRLILPLDDGRGEIGRLLVGNVPGARRA